MSIYAQFYGGRVNNIINYMLNFRVERTGIEVKVFPWFLDNICSILWSYGCRVNNIINYKLNFTMERIGIEIKVLNTLLKGWIFIFNRWPIVKFHPLHLGEVSETWRRMDGFNEMMSKDS